jgi:hypothetical protein
MAKGAAMYPSGRWRGYWQQAGFGRQRMRDLVLHFDAGRIEGRGVDIVGPFTFEGEYDETGAVVLVKHYLKRHQVLYRGRYDGEGTIFGEWSIDEQWRGAFALSPEGFEVPADAPILTIAAVPPGDD